ncbi:hypothetical protein HWV62_23693, partial [Athelia sp. TMB]
MPASCFQFAKQGYCKAGEDCRFEHGPSDWSVLVSSPIADVVLRLMPQRQVPIRRVRRNKRTASLIEKFFEQYPPFDYDSSQPVMSEFWRMCHYFGWNKKDEEQQEAREELKDAMVQQFNDFYGTDIEDINSWQILCGVLGISPVPQELKACREVVKRTHVNIVDLVDNVAHVEVFKSLQDLRTYTIEESKYFPKENAYAGGVLKFLLREILNPWEGRGG